jgi:hypothetical protein
MVPAVEHGGAHGDEGAVMWTLHAKEVSKDMCLTQLSACMRFTSVESWCEIRARRSLSLSSLSVTLKEEAMSREVFVCSE